MIGKGGLLLCRSICPPMACRPQRTAATWSVEIWPGVSIKMVFSLNSMRAPNG